MKIKLALLCALAFSGANAMACYTVYDSNNRVLYQGAEPPVDMSQPIHETLGKRFPGAHMVFDQQAACTPVALAQVHRTATPAVPAGTIRMEKTGRTLSPSSSAPLLTDRDTAQRNGLPYTAMGGDIVMVPGTAVARARLDLPTYSVVPAEPQLARAPQAPDTRAMGAGPASLVAGVTSAQPETVITEMRDGVTYIQRGNSLSIRR